MREFREVSSQYLIENKEDSEEISSDGEFRNADKMVIYREDDIELHRIDATKKRRNDSNVRHMPASQSVTEEVKKKVQDGVKSIRNKGLKHFNKVGYMGHDLKEVPRWACSEAILKVVEYQK